MSFITYGQSKNGVICTCKAMCISGCLCDCLYCEVAEVISAPEIQLTEAEKEHWIMVEKSQNISAYQYNEETQELQVIFKDRTHGCYFDVPVEVFEQLQKEKSKGSYIASAVAKSYRYRKQGRIA